MRGRKESGDFIRQARRDLIYEEHVQDPYLARGKLAEPTVCPECGAVYHAGRWQWAPEPEGAHTHSCPACSRIHDHVPAGILSLSGDFFREHKDDIMHLIQHTEEKEKAKRPLERIMSIENTGGEEEILISFTGIHLVKRAGDALRHAYQGEFDFAYSERDDLVRAHWVR
jgi:NMD protein affecting ribosome stability and mRNA decay